MRVSYVIALFTVDRNLTPVTTNIGSANQWVMNLPLVELDEIG